GAGVLLIEGWRLGVAVIRYPQLFDEALYAHGGARRALQLLLTDHVPRLALELVGWAALAPLFLGPAATGRGRAWVAALRAALGALRVGLRHHPAHLPVVGDAPLRPLAAPPQAPLHVPERRGAPRRGDAPAGGARGPRLLDRRGERLLRRDLLAARRRVPDPQ